MLPDFGPRENNIVQTVATAAGGLSSVFVSGIPAMYQLDLLSTPKEDFSRLITLTIVGAYFGFTMSTPRTYTLLHLLAPSTPTNELSVRKFFIIYVARELKLVFPTPSATAMTIRAMHMAATGETIAKLKMRALGIAFSIALVLRVVSQYATGIIWDWHFFTWIYIWQGYKGNALAAESWGWVLEWTPAFIGAGMLVGPNPAVSFYAGSVMAWGIIGPTLIKYNAAFGRHLYADPADGMTQWAPLANYNGLGAAQANKDTPSPRCKYRILVAAYPRPSLMR